MLKSIKNDLSDQPDTVLTELNDCFKVVSASLQPSERGVYITDNKIECRLVVESFLPKEALCSKAAISIETCGKVTERRTPVKGYKTDLGVNSSVSALGGSPKKGQDVVDDTTEFLSR